VARSAVNVGEVEPGVAAVAARAELGRDVQLPGIADGALEYYADPVWGWIVSTEPVWEDLG